MRHELTADTLARLILWGLDQATAGRARPLRLWSVSAPDAPLVATLDYLAGFPCLWVTPLAFYGEKTATLLQALDRCLQTGKLDEVECCLLHALEPGRSLVFDWPKALIAAKTYGSVFYDKLSPSIARGK